MNREELRYRLEANAIAVCLSFAGLCFAAGLVLQHAGRAVDRAATLGGPRG